MNFSKKVSLVRFLFLALAAAGFITSCEQVRVEPGDDDPNDTVKVVENSYTVFAMDIKVANNAAVTSKDTYLNCNITVNGQKVFDDYKGSGQIRGRGNSSWLWYDKKPYRIKLDVSSGILGLKSNRDWVLLANYRDPTDLMNTFSFEVADLLGLPFVNHTRYVEVTLNGNYIGLYQLTEQVEEGNHRVDIDEARGVLISLDADDGPYYSPDAGNNFWSSVFDLPVSVKYPEIPTAVQISDIQHDFAQLENAIKNHDYEVADSLMDMKSFIDYLILEEFVYNVEIDAPRSVFMFKDDGGKYVMGPAWDFDAGFDFDWGTMMTGHNYFNAQELVMGTDPANHTNGYAISGFFTQMFLNERFVNEFKARWNEVKGTIFADPWSSMEQYNAALQDALARDLKRWPIDKNYNTETSRMKTWLSNRVTYLNSVINNYPGGTVVTTKTDCGTLTLDVTMSYALGYSQIATVKVDEASLLTMLGISKTELYGTTLKIIPLKTDGTEGINNTNGKYGGWFDSDNNPGYWSNGHVYIEINDNLTEWSCGLRTGTGYCAVGDQHRVRMQYQYTSGTVTKTVTVVVNFTIAS
jgi:hypothetical protein